MTLIGYTMMCEQAGPKQLVRAPRSLSKQDSTSRSSATTTSPGSTPKATRPYAWSGLGAAAQACVRGW